MMSVSFLTLPRICIAIAVVGALFLYKQIDRKEEDLSGQTRDLERQIEALKPEANDDPGDQSQLLKHADQVLTDLLAEKKKLSEEYEDQEKSCLELREEFLQYKQDYPLVHVNPN